MLRTSPVLCSTRTLRGPGVLGAAAVGLNAKDVRPEKVALHSTDPGETSISTVHGATVTDLWTLSTSAEGTCSRAYHALQNCQ